MGNLTQIGRMLLALYMAYVAKNCVVLGEGIRDFLWVMSLTIFTVVSIASLVNLISAVYTVALLKFGGV